MSRSAVRRRVAGFVPLVLLALALCGTAGSPAALAAEGGAWEKLQGELPSVLRAAGADELVPVYFVLNDQLEGTRLRERAGITPATAPAARRASVVAALREHATLAQAGLNAELRTIALAGRAKRVRPLWIGNVVGADMRRDDILRLAARPEVARVNWNPKRDVFLGARESTAPVVERPWTRYAAGGLGFGAGSGSALVPGVLGTDGPGTDAIECGVQKMRAPQVWNELGNTGAGAVIAVIDTGVCWTHPDIANQMWVNPGEDINHNGVVMDPADVNGVDDDANGFVDDFIGWDFDNNDREPNDDNSHGSHCAGTIAGDGTGGEQTGMAPDAKIMAVKVGVSFADEVDVWNAMQYAAANGANAISMSLGWPHGQNPDRPTWRTNAENTIEAGTAMVIAAGNEGFGAEPDNVRTPGDVPRVITVGATDCSDVIAGFSSRGPVTWQGIAPWNDHPYPPGLVKPDISAPGVDTLSNNVCSGYSYKSGTSMATPHVAGAVALMVAANPGLMHDDIKAILEETSVDLGAPGKDNEFGTGRVDAYEAVSQTATPDGRMTVREAATACTSTLHMTVSDADLRGAGTIIVSVASTTEPGGESATLTETSGGSGVFKGTINTAPGAAASDGTVQVSNNDTVTATYIDANNGSGGTNVPKTDTASVDCVFPVISAVRAENLGLTTATIRWTTDEASSSSVDYGPTIPPTSSASGNSNTIAHQVNLSGLASCTLYRYRVNSTDGPGNVATSDNGGAYYYFETLADFGSGPQSCHGGKALLDRNVYSCADTVTVEVSDLDLNVSPSTVDSATLMVTSTTETQPEIVVVTETGANTSRFRGTISTSAGAVAHDGAIQTRHGDIVTVSYMDANDGSGHTAVTYDQGSLDCAAPKITNLRIETITDQRVTVRFTTEEPGDTFVEYGTTPALGQTASDAARVTDHAVLLNKFDSCQRIYFRVRSTDQWGYIATADDHGQPLAFSLGTIPGLYYRQTFEAGAPSWTLQGEWQAGAPQGRGGSSGRPDPTAAYNNNGVLGEDLTGLGTFPGDFEPGRTESAKSPTLNASTWQRTKLIVHRRLQAGATDEASIWLWTNSGTPIYRNAGALVDDIDYVVMPMDIRQKADGAPALYVEFRMKSDASGNYSGWNIDDVILKDGGLPDYASCGACGAAPSFAGATGAADNSACGATGVTVSWNQAPAWGSGNGGSYTVYRGTTPDFTPSAANRIAHGVTTTSYNDATAPEGVALWYIVRAENDETCSSGAHNGGVTDANLFRVQVSPTTSQPTPPAIGTLGVTLVADTNVRLTWTAASAATSYKVYRSVTPTPGSFSSVGTTAGLLFDDLGQGTLADNAFYLVRGVNACGTEGP